MRPIELYKHQLAVLPKPAGERCSSIGWSDAPYALCIIPAEYYGNVPEDYADLAVWGLPEEMSVEDAWCDFEPAGEYVIIDNTPTGEKMKLVTLEHEDRVSWEINMECFETPEELKTYLKRYARDGTYAFYGNTVYATISALDAAEEGYKQEMPVLDIATSNMIIHSSLMNIMNIINIMGNSPKAAFKEITRELNLISYENSKIHENMNKLLKNMRDLKCQRM